jgi:tRNA (cytidine32/uridine32-2'-O)-methyltransferase
MSTDSTTGLSTATTALASAADRIRVVLVGTQHPGNIGSAARAMKTMGLSRLVLVAPERAPDADSYALAAGADDVLAAAAIHPSLAEAVADCRLVLGCTARSRRIALEELEPRIAGARAVREAQGGGEIALVFGRERTGLSNDEYELCHAAVHIPANPDYSSLNLAMAVQVLSYEIRLAALAAVPIAGRGGRTPGAGGLARGDGELLRPARGHPGCDRLPQGPCARVGDAQAATAVPARAAGRPEVRILRGVLADAQRMARLAEERDG